MTGRATDDLVVAPDVADYHLVYANGGADRHTQAGCVMTVPPVGNLSDFHSRGVIDATFPLGDVSVLPKLIADASAFGDAVEANRRAGQHCVPYAITDSIRAVAHDKNLRSVIEGILGPTERWVMWGSNIQSGTPNDAGSWHVDLESRLWPSITVAVGLDGCSDANSTRYIPYSHELGPTPVVLHDQSDDDEAIRCASEADTRCDDIVSPAGFETGRFYVFDARGWHSGERRTSGDRVMLFLHYHLASDKRIPLMTDYMRNEFAKEASPFIAGPRVSRHWRPINKRLAQTPFGAEEDRTRPRHKLDPRHLLGR